MTRPVADSPVVLEGEFTAFDVGQPYPTRLARISEGDDRDDTAVVRWRRDLRLSAFEQTRAHGGPALACRPQVRRALTSLMRHMFLGAGASSVSRSVVFVPTRKTNDAALLAAAAAEALAIQVTGQVCLVDADLRTPSLHDRFGIVRAPGVSDLLVNRSMPAAVAIRGNWSLIPAGTCCLEAVRLVATEGARRQLGRLIRRFAHTVIYAPSLAESTDATLLGSLADGVVLVVDEPSMRKATLAALAAFLESADVHIVGAVLHTPRNRLLDLVDRWL